MKYNPVEDNFTSFEAIETPKVTIKLPLYDNGFDVSNWSNKVTSDGIPIVKSNLNDPFKVNNPIQTSTKTSTSNNISFEELLKQENLPVKITSGYRGSDGFRGGKTASGSRSNHNRKDEYGNSMAYDIVPLDGNFEDLLNKIYSNPRIVSWLKSKGYGILEETTPEVMKKTGATGKHLHIGPDSSALAMTQKRLSKAASGLKFPFMSFESVQPETPTIKLPLYDNEFDISSWSKGVTKDNIPIAKDNLSNPFKVNNPTSSEITISEVPITSETSINTSLENVIQEVSKEKGYEELQNPEIKNLLMLQAKRESNFNPKAQSKSSSASGYFQFIDSTRKALSSLSKEDFLNNPKEQVRAAFKNLKNILNSSTAQALLNKGYNKAQVTALGWWYPKSMNMVLNGNTNFSKGGYSIKQALSDYQA